MNPIGPRDLFSLTLQKNIGHRTPKIKLHYIKETLDAVVKEGTARSIYMSKMGECSHNQLRWWSSRTVWGFHSCLLLFIFVIFISFVLWVNIACSISLLKLHCWVEGLSEAISCLSQPHVRLHLLRRFHPRMKQAVFTWWQDFFLDKSFVTVI